MRKVIVSERVTLDGFIAGLHGEMDWMEAYFDEALTNYESELQKRDSIIVCVNGQNLNQ